MKPEALEELFLSFGLDTYNGEDPASKFSILEDALNESYVSPPYIVKMIDRLRESLRSPEYRLDYDDMVIEGTWRRDLDLMIYRDYLIMRLLNIREGYVDERLTDTYLNSAPEEYLNLLDLLRCDLESICRNSLYDPSPEEVSKMVKILRRMGKLTIYGSRLLSVDTFISTSHYRKITYRAREKLSEHIDKCTKGNPIPELDNSFKTFSAIVDELMSNEEIDNIQKDRNANYMERKKWVYEYVMKCVQKLNGELEVCDPYDLTQRKYLTGLINTSHDYLRDMEKDH